MTIRIQRGTAHLATYRQGSTWDKWSDKLYRKTSIGDISPFGEKCNFSIEIEGNIE